MLRLFRNVGLFPKLLKSDWGLGMRRLLSLMLLPLCLFFCMHENASAKDSKTGKRETAVVIDQAKSIAIDSAKVLALNTTKDFWDKTLVLLNVVIAMAGIGAAIYTGKAASATKKSAQATEKSLDELKRQVELQRLDALVKLGNFYQESYEYTKKNMTDILNAQNNVHPNLVNGLQTLYDKYLGEEALEKTLNIMQENRLKNDSIDKEIEKYYNKLVIPQ